MSNKKYLLLITFILLNLLVTAQNIILSGKILDRKTLKPLPYTNIQLNKTGIGTITGKNGKFYLKIPKRYYNRKISFSFIGYKTEVKNINSLKQHAIIYLQPEDEQIGEIIIMPDSTLFTLLEKAYKKIPENYPMYPTKLKGFYKEAIKTMENKYLYFSEAVIETYKSSYKHSADNGQVKILKSMVNEFPDLDLLKRRFYAGIFEANEGDFVKKRIDFINPRYFKDYNYTLFSITKYQNKEVYIISFDTKNDSLKGTKSGKFYIEKSSLAYVGCEYEDTKRGLKNYNRKSNSVESTRYKTTVSYIKYNDKWHFKYSTGEMIFREKKMTYKINGEYITTEIYTDTVKPIPFAERLEFSDVFSEKAKDHYSDDYWEEYNVLKKDSFLENQIKLLYDTTESKKLLNQKTKFKRKTETKNNLFKILSHFSFGYGLSYFPVHADKSIYGINYQDNNKTISLTEELDAFQYSINLMAQINYNLNYRWSLNFAVHSSLNKKLNVKTYDIGASYRMLLNKRTKPIILNLSLLYSFNSFARNFSIYQNTNEFEFGNKTIDAEKLQFAIGCNTGGLKPKVSLEYKFKRRLWLYVSGSYYLPFYTKEKLYLKEKTGFFLTRKNSNISLNDESLDVTYNGVSTNKSHISFDNYTISLGIIFRF